MYKMSYYRFPELFGGQRTVDRVRQQDIPASPTLDVLEEAFTTENWIVRPASLLSLHPRDLWLTTLSIRACRSGSTRSRTSTRSVESTRPSARSSLVRG